jgi:chromosome segregation ATPase
VNERLNERTQQFTAQQADLSQLQEQLREIERTYAVSKTEGDQMREAIAAKEEELRKLGMTMAEDQQSLREATQRLNESELQRKHMDEQVRVAKETQGALEEELKAARQQAARLQDQLVAVQSDRDRFRSGIDQRETQLGQIQAELSNVRRELATAQAESKQLELGSTEREQQLIVDREGYKWHVDRLQRELERAQAAYRQLSEEREQQLNAISARTVSKDDYDRTQDAITDARNQIAKLNAEAGERDRVIAQLRADVAQRERDVKASQQAVAKAQELLQIPTVPLAPRAVPMAPMGRPQAAASSSGAEVKVYRANAEHNFVVISVEGLGDPKSGDTIVLYVNNQPAAEVQLGDIDQDGMAVAYIKRKLDPGVVFQQGDVVMARHFAQPEDE